MDGAQILLAIGTVVLLWWSSTLGILLLDRRPLRWGSPTIVLSSVIALGAFVLLWWLAPQRSTAAIYGSFAGAIAIWAWHEMTFLGGLLTGPRKSSWLASEGASRLREATRVVIHHELGILASAALLVALTWGAPNLTGLWAFLVLWLMRLSAKFNLYLGVRNSGRELLPDHLSYVGSYFGERRFNALWPASVLGAGLVLWAMLDEATVAGIELDTVLVSTLLALAILEHGMLVAPFDANAMWRVSTRVPTPRQRER